MHLSARPRAEGNRCGELLVFVALHCKVFGAYLPVTVSDRAAMPRVREVFMQLDDALIQIADIRQSMARAGTFRGYWSVPTAVSGGLALVAAGVQQRWIGRGDQAIDAYVQLWGGVAIVSMVIAGVAMAVRLHRLGSQVQRSMSLTASAAVCALPHRRGDDEQRDFVCLSPGVAGDVDDAVWAGSLCVAAAFASADRMDGWILFAGGDAGAFGAVRAAGTVDDGAEFWHRPISDRSDVVLDAGAGRERGGRMSRDAKSDRAAVAGAGPKEPGQFAYGGLERVIHERARLSILSSLAAHPAGLLFNDLKALCHLTDGNLSRQLSALQSAEMVEVWKGTKNRRPQTLCRLTTVGRKRFLEYIEELERVVQNAQSSGLPDGGAPPHQRIAPLRPGTAGA